MRSYVLFQNEIILESTFSDDLGLTTSGLIQNILSRSNLNQGCCSAFVCAILTKVSIILNLIFVACDCFCPSVT